MRAPEYLVSAETPPPLAVTSNQMQYNNKIIAKTVLWSGQCCGYLRVAAGDCIQSKKKKKKKCQNLEWFLGKDAASTKCEVNYLPKFTWLANS